MGIFLVSEVTSANGKMKWNHYDYPSVPKKMNFVLYMMIKHVTSSINKFSSGTMIRS